MITEKMQNDIKNHVRRKIVQKHAEMCGGTEDEYVITIGDVGMQSCWVNLELMKEKQMMRGNPDEQ